jgi:putative phosphoesterase
MAKILCISDLHTDHHLQNREALIQFLSLADSLSPDALIVAGDIAVSLEQWKVTLNTLSSLKIPVYIVPGNHDLWIDKENPLDSWKRYSEVLPTLCDEAHCHWLPGAPVKFNNFIIAGSPGWYDYKMLPEEHPFTKEELAQKKRGIRRWMDGWKCDFSSWPVEQPSDPQLCSYFYKQLLADLKKIQSPFGEETINLLVTHFLPHRGFLRFEDYDWEFNYFGAFMGSPIYSELHRPFHIHKHICGHLHRVQSISSGDTEIFTCPLGYLREWKFKDPKKQVEYCSRLIG